MLSDPIADMLTRIRNGYLAKKKSVAMPNSTMKAAIAQVLKDNRYITDYKVTDTEHNKKELKIDLTYIQGKPAMTQVERISKAGRRIYEGKDNLPYVLSGLGMAIISTSHGLMTANQARTKKLGGEVVAKVW